MEESKKLTKSVIDLSISARRFRIAREALPGKCSQSELAKRVYGYTGLEPVNENTVINKIEHGKRPLTPANAEKYAPVLGVRPAWLTGESDIKNLDQVNGAMRGYIENIVKDWVHVWLIMAGFISLTPAQELSIRDGIQTDVIIPLAYAIYERNLLDDKGKAPAPGSYWEAAGKTDYLAEVAQWKNEKRETFFLRLHGSDLLGRLYADYRSAVMSGRDMRTWMQKSSAIQSDGAYTPDQEYGKLDL